MSEAVIGARIRERRRKLGVTQAEMARRIGISPSYLNLIERNKRRIAGQLLRRTAEELGLGLEDLDDAAEQTFIDALREIGHRPGIREHGPEVQATADFVGRYPGWARSLMMLSQTESTAQETVRALSDRLIHDPFLGEAVHRMLSRIAAVRSASDILSDYDDISPEERSRFDSIIRHETHALSDVGETLASYFDTMETAESAMTPLEQVDALFALHQNHFPMLENAVDTEKLASDPGNADALFGPTVEAVLDSATDVTTAAGKARCRTALFAYAALAQRLPSAAFAAEAKARKYDVEALADVFQVPIHDIFRRLTALAPDGGHPRFGYISANSTGGILEMFSIPGVGLPRHAEPCPLWVLSHAQQTPGVTVTQHAAFQNGAEFLFAARARNTGAVGFGTPNHMVSDMLTIARHQSEKTVYSTLAGSVAVPVGPSCRICPRTRCPHRVEDPFLA